MKQKTKRIYSKIVMVALVASVVFQGMPVAQAASVTSLRAVFDRLKTGVDSEGITLTFVTPTGIQTGGADTITLTFSSDFVLAAEAAANFDIGLGDSGTCSTATYTDEIVALSPSATDWGVDVTGQVITLSPETDDVLTAGFCFKVEMGNDATTGGTGAVSTVANGAIDDDDTIAIGGGFGDTGTLAVDIITEDQVNVTATVDPTITFSVSDTTIGFGSLSSTAARFATGDTLGSGSDSAAAHTLAVATNAASGYVLSYNGATLTSGGNTIDVAAITNDADGTQSIEEFALGISTNGSSTVATGYDHNAVAGSRDWAFVAGTTTTIISRTTPTNTETVSAFYLSNIAGNTEAGSYSTNITYIATGTF